jgi:hypothetical protein
MLQRLVLCLAVLCAVVLPHTLWAAADRAVKVGDDAVLRFADDNSEVALFGVNYYVPFSIDYKRLAELGLDHDRAIREDVNHFQRLGLTAIRLHCWDREISDREGNLVDNEHLRLLDLLISECKARGIYCVMTPIAWWGAPQPGGFSDLYTINQMTTDMVARAAQCRYLAQYMNHVNRYTGLAYKDDPAIPVIELINEPLYPKGTTDEQITKYMDDLAAAVRSTGCRKPIFYNCWQDRLGALGASTLEGGTFGWYPTGLVNGAILKGDFLPRVNDYATMRDPRIARKAKIVYEFDAADVQGSYMYPAMARAFRSGGAQIATQFQYEPMCIGGANSNWQTHYLTLPFTPHKAISFAIAAEAFRRIPRLATFGEYPASAHFGDFTVSHEKDLSQLAAPDAFLYSNDTDIQPPAPDKLTRIAGCGSSPLVTYPGTGAYFLDQLGPGVWALQVYPDAVMVADPYTGGSNEKVRILWAKWPMQVHLPDLGDGFYVCPVSADRVPGAPQPAPDGSFDVTPGEYVLVAKSAQPPQRLTGPTFIAPPSSTASPAAFCEPPRRWAAGKPLTVRATVAVQPGATCELRWRHVDSDAVVSVPMTQVRGYEYEGTIPAQAMTEGAAGLSMVVRGPQGALSFPGGRAGEPQPAAAVPPLSLVAFKPDDALPTVGYSGPEGKSARATFERGTREGRTALAVDADGFGEPPSCAGFHIPIKPITGDLSQYTALRIVARGGTDTDAMEFTLVTGPDQGFGFNVPLRPQWREIIIPLDRLRPMWKTPSGRLDLASVAGIRVVFGAWLLGWASARPHSVEIESVELVAQAQEWEVDVLRGGSDVQAVECGLRRARFSGGQQVTVTPQLPGMDRGKKALRVTSGGFGEAPSSAGTRLPVEDDFEVWREELKQADTVIITARALYPQTTSLEVVLIEKDGAPWGLNVPLSTDWQAIRIPIEKLRYFSHWKSGPAARGIEGDRLHPENLQSVSLCFGAWLYGEDRAKPHGFEIQDVRLSSG